MKLVSIIIPVYNGEKCMRNAIESCISQTYANIEIILINDGSADNTQQIAEEYLDIDNRIVLHNQENKGQSAARNMGLNLAKGEYIQFLDCDDTLDKECVQKTMDEFEKYPEASFVLFGFNIYSDKKLLRTPNPGTGVYRPGDKYKQFIPIQNLMDSPCNKLYKKSYIKTFFQESRFFAEDTIFNYENFLGNDTVAFIENSLYNVQLCTENSVNKRYKQGNLLDYVYVTELIEKKLSLLFAEDFDIKSYRTKRISSITYIICRMVKNVSKNVAKQEINGVLEFSYFWDLINHTKKGKFYIRVLYFLISEKLYFLINMYGAFIVTLYNIKKVLKGH